ncbi:hypothetical protein BZA77DRAFT_89976 [Pyronema omphalodes]|nr:hypothetical protein BZA77DRAFT_89976 [Pyronema omphalodes]
MQKHSHKKNPQKAQTNQHKNKTIHKLTNKRISTNLQNKTHKQKHNFGNSRVFTKNKQAKVQLFKILKLILILILIHHIQRTPFPVLKRTPRSPGFLFYGIQIIGYQTYLFPSLCISVSLSPALFIYLFSPLVSWLVFTNFLFLFTPTSVTSHRHL